MTDEQKAMIRRAADWLEANPDKHIGGAMAANAARQPVNLPSLEAECFCALGRIAFEAGILTDAYSKKADFSVADFAAKRAGLPDRARNKIMRTNDGDRITCIVRSGNPEVIPYLRELAA